MFHPSWVNDVRGRNCPIKGTHLSRDLLIGPRRQARWPVLLLLSSWSLDAMTAIGR